MERIIKIFRRVMLAVVIIPFLSVFAMPDYSTIRAADDIKGTIYNGPLSVSIQSLPTSQEKAISFGNGKIWKNGNTIVLNSVILLPNSSGVSIEFDGSDYWDHDSTIESVGGAYVAGDVNIGRLGNLRLIGDGFKFGSINVPTSVKVFNKNSEFKSIEANSYIYVENGATVNFTDNGGSPSIGATVVVDNGVVTGNSKTSLFKERAGVEGAYAWFANYKSTTGYNAGGLRSVVPFTERNGVKNFVAMSRNYANNDIAVMDAQKNVGDVLQTSDFYTGSGNGKPITATIVNGSGETVSVSEAGVLGAGTYPVTIQQDSKVAEGIPGFYGTATLTISKKSFDASYFQQTTTSEVPKVEFSHSVVEGPTINTRYQDTFSGAYVNAPEIGRYYVQGSTDATDRYNAFPWTTIGPIFDNRANLVASDFSLNMPSELKYTGEYLTPTITFADDVMNDKAGIPTFMYQKQGTTDLVDRPQSAGIYDVYLSAPGGTNYLPVENLSVGTLTVAKADLTQANFTHVNNTVPYDGTSKKQDVSYFDTYNTGDIHVTYREANGDETDNPIDVGKYTVFVTTSEGDNYNALETPVEVGTLDVEKAAFAGTHVQVADNTKTYDGTTQNVTVTIPAEYGTVDSVYYTDDVSGGHVTPKNTGEYNIYANITGSKNYHGANDVPVGVLTINKATPVKSDFKMDDKATYTGEGLAANVAYAHDLLTDATAGKLLVKYNGSENLPVNVGKYDVTVETAGGTNYNPVTIELGTFEVTKAPVTKADLTGKANNATYDGKSHGASYDWKAGMVGTGALTLTYKGEGYDSTVEPVTAGTYAVYASAPAGDNYQALESVKIADLKISKADLFAKNFNDVSANYVYDFKPHPAKVAYLPGTEGTSPITVTYKTAAGKTVSGAPTNAGTYEVYAQALKAGVNYNAMAKPVKVGTIKIAKADKPLPQIKVSNNKFMYDGKSHQAKVTMDKKYGDLSVAYKDEQGKTVAKPTNVGVYQIVVNTVSDNFEALKNVTVGELTITAATPKSSEFTFTKSGTYNGKSQSAKVAYAPGVTKEMAGKITVHYVDAKGNKTNSITNAGTYKVYVSTTGGTNFKPVNNLLVGSMTIAKARVASAEFSVKDTEVTFNGQSQSPNVTLSAKYGDITKIEYRDENGKIYDKVENPGKYDILVTTKGTANYAGADRLAVGTFTIDEQTPEPTPTPAPNDNGGSTGGGTTPAASTVVPASGPATYNATTTVPATTAGTATSTVAPATQTPTQTQATATPAADNATIRHGSIEDSLHGPEEVGDPVKSAAQKENDGLSNYTIAGIWIAVAIALAGVFYIGMRWMQVGRKRHMIQR